MSVRRFPRASSRPLSLLAEPLLAPDARSAVVVWTDSEGVSAHGAHVEPGRDVVGLVFELLTMAVRLCVAAESEPVEEPDE